MDKERKFELILRSLGIRHKLKVHESMKGPDNHEDLAVMFMAKWELEDELRAIEELIAEGRSENVSAKKAVIRKEGTKNSPSRKAATSSKKRSKKS